MTGSAEPGTGQGAGPAGPEDPANSAVIAGFVRRMLGSMTLLLVVGIGIALFLDGRLRLFGLAAIALKAGTDLARFRLRLRWLRAAAGADPDEGGGPD